MRAVAQRNFGLDLLRCLAIAIVLANHAFLGFFVELGDVAWTGWKAAVSTLSMISIEWLFVLSGFLIGTMMMRSFEVEPTWWKRTRSFWLRRWFRTLPNYYLFLGVNCLIVLWGATPLPVGEPRWQFLVFAQNLFGPEHQPLFFNESWTLALDEWFYLVLPLLVGLAAVAGAGARRSFAVAAIALIAIPTVLRFAAPLPEDNYAWDFNMRRVTILHLDATGWGVLAAMVNRWRPEAWLRNQGRKALAGAALMAIGLLGVEELVFDGIPWRGENLHIVTQWPRLAAALILTCTGAGTFLAFPWITTIRPFGPRWRHIVEDVSNYTYSIYLSHFPVMFIVTGVLNRGADDVNHGALWLELVLWLVLVFVVSRLVYTIFEKPLSDLRERYTRKVDASPFGPATPP